MRSGKDYKKSLNILKHTPIKSRPLLNNSLKMPIKKKKVNPRVRKIQLQRISHSLRTGLILCLGLILLGGLAFVAIKFVLNLRGGSNATDLSQSNAVVEGFTTIPVYPESEFIYKDRMNEEIVKTMLSRGISVYRTSKGTATNDVYDFYQSKLPEKGWEFIKVVNLGDEDQKYGQYWKKENKGLRIYTNINDIWYEQITVDEANSGLADRIKEENERKLILSSNNKQSLLPDFPWVLEVPGEYIIKYSATEIKDLQSATIQKIGSKFKLIIYPIAYIGSKPYDDLLNDFTKLMTTDESKWGIVNSEIDYLNGKVIIKASIVADGGDGEAIVLGNYRNNVVYIIASTQKADPLFKYVLDNIKEPAKTYEEAVKN